MSLTASSQSRYYLTVFTLLDQLDPKEYNWQQVSVILRRQLPSVLANPLDGTKASLEFCRIMSKFLVDQGRAGFFWVNSKKCADLARYLLDFLRNK